MNENKFKFFLTYSRFARSSNNVNVVDLLNNQIQVEQYTVDCNQTVFEMLVTNVYCITTLDLNAQGPLRQVLSALSKQVCLSQRLMDAYKVNKRNRQT